MTPFESLTLAMLLWSGAPLKVGGAFAPPSIEYRVGGAVRAADEWFAEDKLKHLAMSVAVVGFTNGGARVAVDAETSLGVAVAAGVAAGLWKELHDRRRGRPVSTRDLVWDAVGVGIGAFVASKAR